MSEAKIAIDIDIGVEDYRRVLYWYSKTRLIGTGLIVVILVISLGLAWVFFAFSMAFRGLHPVDLIPMSIPLPISVLILFLLAFKIRSQAKSLAQATEPTRFTFTADGLSAVAPSSTGQMVWNKFVRVCETKSDFIFFPLEIRFYPIPKRFFQNHQQIVELRALLTDALGDKAILLSD